MDRLPLWFKQDIPDSATLETMRLFLRLRINTVCQLAKCPNLSYCFRNNRFSFMLLGNSCTRHCRFCNIGTGQSLALAQEPSLLQDEPYRISQVIEALGLDYVVLTSVSRDDLSDGGASEFAKTVKLIRRINRRITIELLIPDFQGKVSSLKCLLEAGPDIVGHNIECVQRLYKDLRPQADYALSLGVLKRIKELAEDVRTKSSIMLGLGETKEEVARTMQDLRANLCDSITVGQYLAPSKNHFPVKEFIGLRQFEEYKEAALALGFKPVESGPKARSSFPASVS